MNRYLMDKASRDMARGRDRQSDGRNPYGSRGGYVTSRRGRRDRGMYDMADYRDYDMARGGRGRDRDMARGQDGHYPMEYEMYGVAGIKPMDYGQGDYARGGNRGGGRGSRGGRDRDYGMDYQDYGDYGDYGEYDMARGRRDRDYGYDMDYAEQDMEKEWKEHLKKWEEELKRYDKFKIPKEQIVQQAKQMKLKFDNYTDDDLYATYLMKISDDEDNVISSPQMAIVMAKSFLEDKDSKLKGSEKLCAYYYEIVKGGEE